MPRGVPSWLRCGALGSVLVGGLVSLPGCAHTSEVETQLRTLGAMAADARARGAYRCAPEELARSETHLELAERELDEGNAARARQHLVLADDNARAALRLSQDRACEEAVGPPEARRERARSRPQWMRGGSTKEDHASI